MKFIDYNITDMESEYAFSKRKINDALERCNLQQAVQECYAWAKVIADKLGFSFRDNWKLFKKNLVAYYFGKTPMASFDVADRSVERFLTFLGEYKESVMRMTVHKSDEACHSYSAVLPKGGELQAFKENVERLQGQDCLVVFPEVANKNTICFRCAVSAFQRGIYFEAGRGQAYLTFEAERGKHPIASVYKNQKDNTFICDGDRDLVDLLNDLIDKYGNYLIATANRMCGYLGAEYISVEGYYDISKRDKPVIVDCDLPFDTVFFGKPRYY